MNEQEFKRRTKMLALHVIELAEELPQSRTADVLGRQLIRSGTSIGANYRSACRGKSIVDVLAKLAIVEEEADETVYWLELLIEGKIVSEKRVADPLKETNEILAMTVASIKTLRGRR
jgi:four helix bundle protein